MASEHDNNEGIGKIDAMPCRTSEGGTVSVRLMPCHAEHQKVPANQAISKFVRPHHIDIKHHPFYLSRSIFRGGDISEP